jgi:hypothetical protein
VRDQVDEGLDRNRQIHGCPVSPGTGRRSWISLLASQISRLSGSDNGREAGGVFSDARGSDVVPGIGLGHATRPVTNLARLLLRVSPAMAAGVTDQLWALKISLLSGKPMSSGGQKDR